LSKTKQQIETFYSQQNGLFKYEPLLGYYKGQALLYEGNEEAAKRIWQETMTADPEIRQIPIALKNLKLSKELKEEGSNLYKNNKTKEAIEKWEKSVSLDIYHKKFNSLVYGNLMTAYNKLNDNSKSLKAINEALRLDPNFAKGYFKRGQIYCKIEDYQEAAKDYQTAQNLDPSLNLQGEIQKVSQKASKQAKTKDYYAIIGVKKDATNSEITKAYRKLCLKYHPDRQDNEEAKELANKKMLDINEAYGVLKDADKRKKYDMGGVEGANMDFPTSDFSGFSGFPGFNMGGNGGGKQSFKFTSSNGGDIPPQFYQMFFQDGSNNTFNFSGNSKNSKKPDHFSGFGDDDDIFKVFTSGGLGGFGGTDFGGFGNDPFKEFQSGPQRQKFKFSSKKR